MKKKLKGMVGFIILGILFIGIVSFTEVNHGKIKASELIINFSNQADNFFIDHSDVEAILTEGNTNYFIGNDYKSLELNSLEDQLEEESFIKTAELFTDLKGNVVVNIALRRPMTRILRNGLPDAYVAEDGVLLPTSEKFNSRVILISGAYTNAIVEANVGLNEFDPELFGFLKFIYQDPFWSAQVAQVVIDSSGEITILPQVTKQKILFGKAEGFENKFRKVRIFYDKILPRSWNKYSTINVKFQGQIIAE